MSKKSYTSLFVALFVLLGFTSVQFAYAQTNPGTPPPWGQGDHQGQEGQDGQGGRGMGGGPRMGMMGNGIGGTVTAISGSTITVEGRHASTTTATTYTVDATNAKVMKGKTASTVSAIAVGDTIFAQGTVSGTSVTATLIIDGIPPRGDGQGEGPMKGVGPAGMRPFGMGIHGTVTAVSGFSLTVDGKMGTSTATTTYSVDATNAKVYKDKATSTVSSIAIGDTVLVQGTVSGTSVTATTILDGKLPTRQGMKNGNLGNDMGFQNGGQHSMPAFLSKIGDFFKGLFHFGGH